MRLSPDPARAELQRVALDSRHSWMETARIYKRWLGVRFAQRGQVAECILMARRASRAAWQMNRSPN